MEQGKSIANRPNGAILHETPQIIVIATGLSRKSNNPKTGGMIQVWILNRQENPIQALKSGSDAVVCFDCPLRNNGCYVRTGDAPLAIWRAYSRGRYPRLSSEQYAETFGGRFVRIGAYGEPVLIPFPMLKAIAEAAEGFTGYTHQWRNPYFSAYKRYLMASTDERDYQKAILLGWRTFTIARQTLPDLMICPASHEYEQAHERKLSCVECGQCAGLSRKGRSVQIQPHGYKQKYVLPVEVAA